MERAGLGIEVTVHVQDDCDVCASELQIGATNNEGEFCLFVCLYHVCASKLQIATNNEGEFCGSGRCCCKSRERERGREMGESCPLKCSYVQEAPKMPPYSTNNTDTNYTNNTNTNYTNNINTKTTNTNTNNTKDKYTTHPRDRVDHEGD